MTKTQTAKVSLADIFHAQFVLEHETTDKDYVEALKQEQRQNPAGFQRAAQVFDGLKISPQLLVNFFTYDHAANLKFCSTRNVWVVKTSSGWRETTAEHVKELLRFWIRDKVYRLILHDQTHKDKEHGRIIAALIANHDNINPLFLLLSEHREVSITHDGLEKLLTAANNGGHNDQ